MLGIQITDTGSTVVAWTGAGLELIGSGKDLEMLVGVAKGREGVEAGSAVVAVPAWYHDGQRAEVRDRVKAAGVEKVMLANEPMAIALAYGMTQPALPERSLVLSLSESGALDVTILALQEAYVEVVAANGIPEVEAAVMGNGDRFFAAIEPVVNRALADAGMTGPDLDAIVLAGKVVVLRSVAERIEAAWGRAPGEPPSPERAVADGAAIYGRMMRDRMPAAASKTPPGAKSGCAGVLVLALLGLLAIRILADC